MVGVSVGEAAVVSGAAGVIADVVAGTFAEGAVVEVVVEAVAANGTTDVAALSPPAEQAEATRTATRTGINASLTAGMGRACHSYGMSIWPDGRARPLVGAEGLEPPTPCASCRCSSQLS